MVQFKGVIPENVNTVRQVSVVRQISAHLTKNKTKLKSLTLLQSEERSNIAEVG